MECLNLYYSYYYNTSDMYKVDFVVEMDFVPFDYYFDRMIVENILAKNHYTLVEYDSFVPSKQKSRKIKDKNP